MAALIAIILILLPFSGFAQNMPGTLIDVGGYRVHLYCTGSGSPTVMLIGGFSFDWALVQPEVAKFTRVCTYDASGTAWSDGGPQPTCRSCVDEIHKLIQSAQLARPMILAGFSIGALYARVYAQDYPADVAAMVLIDHAFLPKLPPPPANQPAGPDSPPALISATPIDIGLEDEPGFDKLPENVRTLHRWAMSLNPVPPDPEVVETCVANLDKTTLGSLPLVVVSTTNDAPGYRQLQTSLLALSTSSTQRIADHSFHSIEVSQPGIVIEAIRLAIRTQRK